MQHGHNGSRARWLQLQSGGAALKEGRPLVLVPRETPLSEIHLENMLELTRMGAICLPAMPGFYHHPQSIDDLIQHLIGKLFDRLGLEYQAGARWAGLQEPTEESTQFSEGAGSP